MSGLHCSIEGYAPTRLVSLKGCAGDAGIRGFLVKDESTRFGLKAFKPLGGIYAMFRIVCAELGLDYRLTTLDQILDGTFRDEIAKLTFITTTDGNHGKGVSWASGIFGSRCHVFMPKGTVEARAQAVRDAGNAEVTVTEEYAGAHYQSAGQKTLTAIMAEDGLILNGETLASAAFTNEWDETVTYGSGIVNHYTNNGSGWANPTNTGGHIVKALTQNYWVNPKEPIYTLGLLRAVTSLGGENRRLYTIPGIVPPGGQWSQGCRFADRCDKCMEKCKKEMPALTEAAPGHLCRCFLHSEEVEQ